MAPWEIWSYDFDVEGTHPVMIFCNAARVSNAGIEQVNVLFCTTLRRGEQRERTGPTVYLPCYYEVESGDPGQERDLPRVFADTARVPRRIRVERRAR